MKKNKKTDYPHWAYASKREWKRDVRRRWKQYKKALDELYSGCIFYPKSVYHMISNCEEDIKTRLDPEMKKFYKGA